MDALVEFVQRKCPIFENREFSIEILDGILEDLDVTHPLSVLRLSFGKGILLHLDLLIDQSKSVISSDKLGSENIPLAYYKLVLLLELYPLVLALLNNKLELPDLILVVLDQLHPAVYILFEGLVNLFVFLVQLLFVLLLVVLLVESLVLGVYLFLELRNLMEHNFVPQLDLSNLVLGVSQIFRVEVSIASDCFVKLVLLL